MSYFIFNDISSQKYGILERCPVPPLSVRKNNITEIPNRSENLFTRLNQYQDITLECVLGIRNKNLIREIYSWLSETGELILSTNVSEKYTVKDIGIIPEYLSKRFAKLNISFLCSPFVHSLTSEPIDITDATSYTKITNNGSVFCEPLIKFRPAENSEEVNIETNGENLKIILPENVRKNRFNVIIDSQLQIIYYIDENGKYFSILPLTYGDIPLLHTGDNYIKHSGNVESMNITLNERWL